MALSAKQKKELSLNSSVLRVTEKQVHYTYEFKVDALELQNKGYSAVEIFEKYNIPIEWFKKNYAKDLLKNWRRIVAEKGVRSLKKTTGSTKKEKPPFDYDLDNLDDLDNEELVQIIEYMRKESVLKKKLEPLSIKEQSVQAHAKRYGLIEE